MLFLTRDTHQCCTTLVEARTTSKCLLSRHTRMICDAHLDCGQYTMPLKVGPLAHTTVNIAPRARCSSKHARAHTRAYICVHRTSQAPGVCTHTHTHTCSTRSITLRPSYSQPPPEKIYDMCQHQRVATHAMVPFARIQWHAHAHPSCYPMSFHPLSVHHIHQIMVPVSFRLVTTGGRTTAPIKPGSNNFGKVGRGFCRENNCMNCPHPFSSDSPTYCVETLADCKTKCEKANTCVGIAYAAKPSVYSVTPERCAALGKPR